MGMSYRTRLRSFFITLLKLSARRPLARDKVVRVSPIHGMLCTPCSVPTRTVLTTRGIECALWTWRSSIATPKALVVSHHGLGGHAHFPTTRLAAESLSAAGFVVVAMDLPGHGESTGLRGYIESADALEMDAVAATLAAKDAHPGLPLFLLGCRSMVE